MAERQNTIPALDENHLPKLEGKRFKELDGRTAKALEVNEIKAIQGDGENWWCPNDAGVSFRDKLEEQENPKQTSRS